MLPAYIGWPGGGSYRNLKVQSVPEVVVLVLLAPISVEPADILVRRIKVHKGRAYNAAAARGCYGAKALMPEKCSQIFRKINGQF